MPKPVRELSVSPGHSNRKVGSCSACLNTCDEEGNFEHKDVWLIKLGISASRLCDDCLDELEKQIHQQKARLKAKKK